MDIHHASLILLDNLERDQLEIAGENDQVYAVPGERGSNRIGDSPLPLHLHLRIDHDRWHSSRVGARERTDPETAPDHQLHPCRG